MSNPAEGESVSGKTELRAVAPGETSDEKGVADDPQLLLTGYTRGSSHLAICCAKGDQRHFVFLDAGSRRIEDDDPVMLCPECKKEHWVIEDFWDGILEAWINVTPGDDANEACATIDISDLFQARLAELRGGEGDSGGLR